MTSSEARTSYGKVFSLFVPARLMEEELPSLSPFCPVRHRNGLSQCASHHGDHHQLNRSFGIGRGKGLRHTMVEITIDVDLAGHISRVLLPLYPSGQEFGGLRVKVETDAHLVYQ